MTTKVIPVRNMNNLPGTIDNMFFEMYTFDPLSTFTEKDVYYVLKFFDLIFESSVNIPNNLKQHFEFTENGSVFKPLESITVDIFVDIMLLAKLNVSEEIYRSLNKNLQEHFQKNDDSYTSWEFLPFDDFGIQDFKEFMVILVQFSLNKEQFETLTTKRLKRQFKVFNRNGKTWRWGSRVP